MNLHPGEHKVVSLGADFGSLELTGRLIDSAGSPADRMTLRLEPTFDWAGIEFESYVDKTRGGGFHFAGLWPGQYAVEIIDWSVPDCRALPLPPIRIAADTTVELAAPDG